MNDWYFLHEKGKTVGPVSGDDIKTRIREGRVRLFDLIYRDGEAEWRMALEHSGLRTEFNAVSMVDLKQKPWVCLQRKAKDVADYVTTGPFNQIEIREALQKGRISYSDY